jgi:hypothetical protein
MRWAEFFAHCAKAREDNHEKHIDKNIGLDRFFVDHACWLGDLFRLGMPEMSAQRRGSF